MELANAISLITDGIDRTSQAKWADLGCGSGLFTRALGELLRDESIITAVDSDRRALSEVKVRKRIQLNTIQSDFIVDPLNLRDLDGIIMANSFHFVKDKAGLLAKLRSFLKPAGCLVLVEYDTLAANKWVPFPIDVNSSIKLLSELGFVETRKLGEQPSRYQRGGIYSLIAKKLMNHELYS